MGSSQDYCICSHRCSHLVISFFFLLVSSSTQVRLMAEGRADLKLVELTQMGVEEKAVVRSNIGSRPPTCQKKCSSCGHCEAIQVPAVPQQRSKNNRHSSKVSTIAYSRGEDSSNYKPMSWKCKWSSNWRICAPENLKIFVNASGDCVYVYNTYCSDGYLERELERGRILWCSKLEKSRVSYQPVMWKGVLFIENLEVGTAYFPKASSHLPFTGDPHGYISPLVPPHPHIYGALQLFPLQAMFKQRTGIHMERPRLGYPKCPFQF